MQVRTIPLAVLLSFVPVSCQLEQAERSAWNGAEDAGASADGDDTDDATSGHNHDGEGDSAGGTSHAGIPCDVVEILVAECGTCHSDPPAFGAPMPLTDYDHFVVPSVSTPSVANADMVVERLHSPDSVMPPDGPLSADAMGALEGWIDGGMPRYEGSDCGVLPDDDGGEDVHDLPCTPSHTFVGHAAGSDAPFQVPQQDDLYMCYTFASPFGAQTQVTAYAPVIDDERVVHHWIMYKTATPQPDGGAGPCDMPYDAQFVAGWAPGGENAVLPDDVGLETAGPGESFILQVHYNNTAGYLDALDSSGVAFCTTETPRPNLAGVLWLGSVLIHIPGGATNFPVHGTCDTSSWSQPFHVMSSSPHMHELGTHFKTSIDRYGGGSESLIDSPFSFKDQTDTPYDPPVVIQPGDRLRSTCTFSNPSGQDVFFGEGTSDEMCFNFVTGYPIDMIDERQCGLIF